MARIAHRLRGSLANFGADEAVEAAFRLERMGVGGRSSGVHDACETLVEGYGELRTGLERLLATR